jgi:LuxR family maltose regulon positive regulatory protein
MLEQAERAGLFLVPRDEVRGWRRYHRLFADLLRTRLQAEQPRRMQELHRAAAWSDEHSLADDAVRHALAPGDTLWAARLTERYFDTFYYSRSEGATLKRWLSMPAELVHARPRLLVAQAALAENSGHLETVESLLDEAERASADAADEPFEPSAGKVASVLVNIPPGSRCFVLTSPNSTATPTRRPRSHHAHWP